MQNVISISNTACDLPPTYGESEGLIECFQSNLEAFDTVIARIETNDILVKLKSGWRSLLFILDKPKIEGQDNLDSYIRKQINLQFELDSDYTLIVKDTSSNGTPTPILVQWDVTNQCNLDCLHCYSRASKQSDLNELDEKMALAFVDNIAKVGVMNLHLLGGEPFTREDIFSIINSATEQSLSVHVSSNGTLIDEKTISMLPVETTLDISIDGRQETHDRLRNSSGAFEKSMRAIRLLTSAGISTGICFTMSQDNIGDLEYVAQCAEETCDRLQILAVAPVGRGADRFDCLGLIDGMREDATARVVELVNGSSSFIDAPAFGYSSDLAKIRDFATGQGNAISFGCKAGYTKCAISANGDIMPCLLHRVPFGNIKNHDFLELWSWLYNYCRTTKVCDEDCDSAERCGGHCRV